MRQMLSSVDSSHCNI